MRTPKSIARIILNSFQDPIFAKLFRTEEDKLTYIEELVQGKYSVSKPSSNPQIPSQAVFESFFEPEKTTIVIPDPVPRQALPVKQLSDLIETAHALIDGEKCQLEMRIHAIKFSFRMAWTGGGDGKSNDCIDVSDIKIEPASAIGKHARALAKYVDWNNSDLIRLVSDRILKSKEFKNFRLQIRDFILEAEGLKSMYEFDFEQDIIQAVQRPCTVVPHHAIEQ